MLWIKHTLSDTFTVIWSPRDVVLYILPFGLVRLITFRSAHGLVRCKLERRCWRACGEDVSFRDVKIKIPIKNLTWGCEWRHAPQARAEDLGDFEKKSQLNWVPPTEEESWLLRARRGLVSGALVVWGRWKSQVYLSA